MEDPRVTHRAPSGPSKPNATTIVGVRWWEWCALGPAIALASLVRLRLLAMPFERDEGEYAYFGQLLLQGVPPYRVAYNMKFPGTYVLNALFLGVFGETAAAVRTGLFIVNVVTVVLVFLVVRRLFGPLAGVAAGATYAVLSLSTSVLGLAAHATHFVAVFAVAGLLVLLVGLEREKRLLFAVSGALLALATLMKQPGALFFPLAAGWLLWRPGSAPRPSWRNRLPDGVVFAVGAAAPLIVTALWLAFAGVFGRFWFWTFRYGGAYATAATPASGWREFRFTAADMFAVAPLNWVLVGFLLVLLLVTRRRAANVWFLRWWLVCSFLAVCPGLNFRPHYFIVLLPAVAALAGWGVSRASEYSVAKAGWLSAAPVVVLLVALAQLVWNERELFFVLPPDGVVRSLYGLNPFPESIPVARYIAEHTRPDEPVAVIGSEPQIYFYSRRRAATGYIYFYPLVENQPFALQMQQEMIREVEAARPRVVVWVKVPTSLLRDARAPALIFDWAKQYMAAHYTVTGIVSLQQNGPSRFIWGPQAASMKPPRNARYLAVFERNDAR